VPLPEWIYSLEQYNDKLWNVMSTGFERIGRDSQLQDHWIRRLVAFIIDTVIVYVCTFVVTALVSVPFIVMSVTASLPWGVLNPFSFFFGIFSVTYFTLFETYYGLTFGKKIMNLKTRKLNGQKPTFDLALIRNISKIHSVLALIDTVIGLATSRDPHQKVSDRIVGTTVVSTGSHPFAYVTVARPAAEFCSHCGQKIANDAKYCSRCGEKLNMMT